MKRYSLTKRDYIVILFIIILSFMVSILNYKELGVKDTAMLFAATFALFFEVYLLNKDINLSILLFIFSFPFLVTARKAVYFDLFLFKITYETIYITILFIFCFKDIKNFINEIYYKQQDKLNYIIYIFIFVIFSLNSAIFSDNIKRSFASTYIAVVVPVMFALSVYVRFRNKNFKHIIYAFILQCDLSCIYGIFQIISNRITPFTIVEKRLNITFGYHNVNIFAGIVILILPFILNEILYSKNSKRIQSFLIISLFFCTGGLFITFTRGAWIAFFLSVLIILISKKYKKLFYVLIALCIAFIKPAMTFILKRGTNMDLLMNESSIARLQSLYTSLFIMIRYPFGIGGGNFANVYKRCIIEGYYMMPKGLRDNITVASYNLEAAHNLWLQIAAEFGIISAAAFFIIILNRFINAVKNFKNCRAEVACIISYLIFSVLTGVEFEHKGIITMTIIIWTVFMIIEFKRNQIKIE